MLLSADIFIFKMKLFLKNLLGIGSEFQAVLIQMKSEVLPGLIYY